MRHVRTLSPAALVVAAVFALSSAAADYYAQEHDLNLSADEEKCMDMIIEMMPGAGGAALQRDMGLVKAARDLADTLASNPEAAAKAPSSKVVRKKLREAGVPENRFYFSYTLYQPGGDFRNYLEKRVKAHADRNPYTHVGAGVSSSDANVPFLVLIFSERMVELEPFPSRVYEGDKVSIEGRLVGQARGFRPAVLLTPASGKVLNVPLLEYGEEFSGTIGFNYGPGTYRLEVMVKGNGNSQVACLMEIKVKGDGASQTQGVFKLDFKDRSYSDPRQAELDVIKMVNQARKDSGLSELREHWRLSEMAKEHSQDMMKNQYVGHRSPTRGSFEERADIAGFSDTDVYENVVLNPSIKNGMEELLESPVHRKNIIRPDVNFIGVGVAITEKAGQKWYYITQEFADID